jgi:hypothetical protein
VSFSVCKHLQVSKYNDVVITSLNLTPKKFTKTLLPAVSMDVLRGELNMHIRTSSPVGHAKSMPGSIPVESRAGHTFAKQKKAPTRQTGDSHIER